VPGQEGARKPVDRDLRQLVEGEAESLRRPEVFIGQRRAAHQTIVGVEDDVHPTIEVSAKRVILVRLDRVRLHIAGQADLERDAPVVHILRQRFVLVEPRGVPDPVCTTDVHRFADI
jgi:hypothetical protein